MNNIIRYKANGSNIISAIDTIEKSRYELDSADNGLFIIKRKSTVKKSLCFFSYDCAYGWRRKRDSNPRAEIPRPNGLANRPLRPTWVFLRINIIALI